MREYENPCVLTRGGNLKGNEIKLPQLGWVEYIKSREIPDGFKVKQVRVVRKASGYFLMMTLECNVNVPNTVASGYPRGIDLGLDKFAATSDGELIERAYNGACNAIELQGIPEEHTPVFKNLTKR